mgnify:CR=1 FL=1
MILDILEKSKKENTLIGLNLYGTDEGFNWGSVLEYTDEYGILLHFSKFGTADGIVTLSLADIKFVETETTYLKGIELLITRQKEILAQTYHLKSKNDFKDGFTTLFESFIGNKDYLIKVELDDEEVYFGFIEWTDEDYFSIINIDLDGIVIGKATFRFEDLKCYTVDDLECRKRKVLFDAVKKTQ